MLAHRLPTAMARSGRRAFLYILTALGWEWGWRAIGLPSEAGCIGLRCVGGEDFSEDWRGCIWFGSFFLWSLYGLKGSFRATLCYALCLGRSAART